MEELESMADHRSDGEDSLSSTSSDLQEAVNLKADEEWEDAEPDQENLEFVSLFDEAVFPSFDEMLEHCKEKFDFDLRRVIKEFGGCVPRQPLCCVLDHVCELWALELNQSDRS